MNNSARNNILNRLKASAPTDFQDDYSYDVVKAKPLSIDEKIKNYRAVCEAVNAQVHEVREETLYETIEQVLSEKSVKTLAIGQGSAVSNQVLASSLPEKFDVWGYDEAVEIHKEKIFNVDASLTGSLGAISRTGSLILWSSKEEPRLLSLVPPMHLCIVYENDFHENFFEAMQVLKWSDNMPTNALLISGPSKTADIEQELCYGVHGPKELIVFIVRT